MSTKDFPRNIRQPTHEVSGFTGSLWDDMDTVPFEYKNHYEDFLARMTDRDEWRHNKLWPRAHQDIYLADKKIGPFTFLTATGEIIRDARYPVPVEGTLRTQQKEKIRIPLKNNLDISADGRKSRGFLAGFLDHLKDSPYEKEFGKWRNRAGSALGGAFASWSWKTMAKYGAAGTVGYGVGVFSKRKANPNDEQ